MTDTELAPTGGDGRGPGGCPVVNVDIGLPGPILSHFEQWDELREQYPAFWTELYGGYWVVTRFDAIRHALQEPATFSNAVDDHQRPEPGVHVHPDVPRPAGARQVPHAVQRPLLAGHGHAGHAGGPEGGQPLHRRLHRRRWLRVHERRSPTRSPPTCSSTPSTSPPPTRRSSCAGCTRCSVGSAARSRSPVLDAQGEMHEYFKAMFDQRRRDARGSRGRHPHVPAVGRRSTVSRSPRPTC